MLFEKLHERYRSFIVKKRDMVGAMIEYGRVLEECVNNRKQFEKEVENLSKSMTMEERRKWNELTEEAEAKIGLAFELESRLPDVEVEADLKNILLFREMLNMIYNYLTDALVILDELGKMIEEKKPVVKKTADTGVV